MELESGYVIDEKDLIIDKNRYKEGDFLERRIEHYPTRSLPLDEEKLQYDQEDRRIEHYPTRSLPLDEEKLQYDQEEEFDVKSMRVVSFLKYLNLGRHYRMWPSWKKNVRYDVALDSSRIYHIPLSSVGRTRWSTRKPRKPVMLKLWVGKSRQVISVEFFPGDTRVDEISDSLEYVQGYLDCKDITLEQLNPRQRDEFMDNVLSICDRDDTPQNVEHLLVYNLSRPDNSLTKASGRWRYRFCNMFVNIKDEITRIPQILKIRVLETKWIQTLDSEMKKAITPCRQDLKLIMSTATSYHHPGRACFRCPYIKNLNKIDLRTFPIASLAWFALIHHNFRKGAKRLRFVAVEKATVQEVAGDIVHIYISAKDDQDQVKVYKTEAFLIGWLESFKFSPLTEVPSTEVVSPGGSEPVKQCCCKPKGESPCQS